MRSASAPSDELERLRSLLSDLPTAIFECDSRGSCTLVNERMCELTGLSAVDAKGTGWLRAIHPDDRTRVAQEWSEAAAARREFSSEYRYLRPDGRTLWIEGRSVPRRASDGSITGLIGTAVDITARRQAEANLRESEQRFRSMADQAPVLIWMAGPDGLASYFNATWLAFTGRSLEQEKGEGWANGVHPEDRELCLQAYLEAFNARERFSLEYRLRRHDGEYRWVADNGNPWYLADGSLAGYLGICQDITDTRRASEVLEHERFLLAESIENAPIAMAMLDTEMRYLAYSRKWLEDYGLIGQKLRGRSHYDVFPAIPERWKALHRRALAGEALSDSEDGFEQPNGEAIILRWAIRRGSARY